jgi:molybdopterin-guanine dinucleotide biosynthesis protein A
MVGDVSGAIVAGGTSARLGTDKRLVAVAGTPLLARTAAALRPLVDDLQVVVADRADTGLVTVTVGADVTLSFDAREGVGPAAGLEAALAAARHELVLLVATDHPDLAPGVLGLLVDRARTSHASAVALVGPRGPEPFLAVYRRSALPAVRAALDGGTRRMQEVLAALTPELIAEQEWRALDPAGATLADVDVPEDLAGLERREGLERRGLLS